MTDYEALKMELEGVKKAFAIMEKGLESACELMDDLKQQTRAQAAEINRLADEAARLRRLCIAHHVDPDRCGEFPGGEQCGRRHGHEGKCCWLNGD
jgi:hypothetical protein